MTDSRELKIWVLITHACIIVGFGHGIIILALIEVFWFPRLFQGNSSFLFSAPFESKLPVIGLLCLSGQVCILMSIYFKQKIPASLLYLTGLVLLWLSIVYVVYNIDREPGVYFGTLTCIPFFVCTVIVFAGKSLRELYKRVVDI